MKKAIATPPGQKSRHVTLTSSEETARKAEELTGLSQIKNETYIHKRLKDYQDKGWKSPFDLIDDILDRGIAAIQTERSAIKAKHPKGAAS